MECEEIIGPVVGVYRGRSKIQPGGVTTALLCYALDAGIIDGAVVVVADEFWQPKAIIATTKEEIMKASGSKWVMVPNIGALIEALDVKRLEKIAIIGTPCQIQALRDIMEYPMHSEEISRGIKLLIGLFCMGSFTRDGFRTLLEHRYGIQLPDIVNMEITKEEFIINLRGGRVRKIPVEDIKNRVQMACLTCKDYTARFSDISIGRTGVEGDESAIIVRNSFGLDIVEGAKNAGVVDISEDRPLLETICEEARKKWERAVEIEKTFMDRR